MDNKSFPESAHMTLNRLLDEQRSLNMRLLLAIQLQDRKTQEELQAGLAEVAKQIEWMQSGAFRHQDLPQ